MARQCCRDSVAMKVIAHGDTAETEGHVCPCRWCERHATYRGGRWIFSDEDEIGLRHATMAALMTHPDRVARIADVLGKPLLPCHTCGHQLVIAPADNRCPVCTQDFAAHPGSGKAEPQGTLADLEMEMDRRHRKQWHDI